MWDVEEETREERELTWVAEVDDNLERGERRVGERREEMELTCVDVDSGCTLFTREN